MRVPMLSDATHGEMDDRLRKIIVVMMVDSAIVGPESGTFEDTKEDTPGCSRLSKGVD